MGQSAQNNVCSSCPRHPRRGTLDCSCAGTSRSGRTAPCFAVHDQLCEQGTARSLAPVVVDVELPHGRMLDGETRPGTSVTVGPQLIVSLLGPNSNTHRSWRLGRLWAGSGLSKVLWASCFRLSVFSLSPAPSVSQSLLGIGPTSVTAFRAH